jgi:site-specific DNA-methyltransferase (adenine-specific)
MMDCSALQKEENPLEPYRQWTEGILVCSDALQFLASLRDQIADIVFLDPPFNLGKAYGNSDGEADLLSDDEYLRFMYDILNASARVLKPGGALYVYHLPQWALRLGSHLDGQMYFRHWIAISMKNGFARGKYLYPAHYALLYFSKGEPAQFDRPKIPAARCRHCGQYIKDYGGYEQYVRNGINLSDVWVDLSPVRHTNRKNRAANELPIELLRRVVQMSGSEQGVLVDPFVGSGTSIVAATESDMIFIACDREESCCEISANRLDEHLAEAKLARVENVASYSVGRS